MSEFIYTKENPLRVFTSFSGYDSQCLALDRIGIPYKLVGWSEIDPFAIQAHNALYPQYADINAGDISKINWGGATGLRLIHLLIPLHRHLKCRIAERFVRGKRHKVRASLGVQESDRGEDAEVSANGECQGVAK